MCKNVGREDRYCKFGGDTCIGLEDIARKLEGGLEIAPPPPQWGRPQWGEGASETSISSRAKTNLSKMDVTIVTQICAYLDLVNRFPYKNCV